MNGSRPRDAGRRDGIVAWVVLLAVAASVPVFAEAPADGARVTRSAEAPTADERNRRGPLVGARPLMQRVGAELETFSALDRLSREGGLPLGEAIHRPLADGVERALLRVGRDEVAERLVEAIELEARLDRLFRRDREPVLAAGAAGEVAPRVEPSSGWEIGLGLSRARPRLELRRATAAGVLRLSISADGRAALRFRGDRRERTELNVDYDGDGRVNVGCAIGF